MDPYEVAIPNDSKFIHKLDSLEDLEINLSFVIGECLKLEQKVDSKKISYTQKTEVTVTKPTPMNYTNLKAVCLVNHNKSCAALLHGI